MPLNPLISYKNNKQVYVPNNKSENNQDEDVIGMGNLRANEYRI